MMTVWRLVNGAMAALFAAGAVLQLNDPDPVGWFVVYAAAATSSFMVSVRSKAWLLAAPTAAAAIVWAVVLRASMAEWAPLSTLFAEFEMRSVAVEETREVLGLGIIALWAIAVCVVSRVVVRERAEDLPPISAP
jgi:hypothetical protein